MFGVRAFVAASFNLQRTFASSVASRRLFASSAQNPKFSWEAGLTDTFSTKLATKAAQSVFSKQLDALAADGFEHDPFNVYQDEMQLLFKHIRQLVGSDNPVLDHVASYYFRQPGKHFRPLVVYLVGSATQSSSVPCEGQARLAQITEIIHVASLIHDDVVDDGTMRRGIPALNVAHGSKTAVLAGDFLLARASLALSRIGNLEVVELLSNVIAHLVEGEIMQMSNKSLDASFSMDRYLQKSFLKTASLIAHAAKASALLGSYDTTVARAQADLAYDYGKHIGLAYQLVDDTLDFIGDEGVMGKKGHGSDMQLGLTTAPVLLAMEEQPRLRLLAGRCFEQAGDVQEALQLVMSSSGIQRSRALAMQHAGAAAEAARGLAKISGNAHACSVLEALSARVVKRLK